MLSAKWSEPDEFAIVMNEFVPAPVCIFIDDAPGTVLNKTLATDELCAIGDGKSAQLITKIFYKDDLTCKLN